MTDIKYTVEFFSQWHCGSGLSAGADVDALVIKDKDGIPFIPGKTMKGLIREAVENYVSLSKKSEKQEKALIETFGIDDAKEALNVKRGTAFFENATIPEKDDIVKGQLQQYLFNKVASTAIDEDGVAQDHSLRTMETVVPCKLTGMILNVPDEFADTVIKSLGMIKRLGQKRNRGLGRCDIKVEKEEGGKV